MSITLYPNELSDQEVEELVREILDGYASLGKETQTIIETIDKVLEETH